MPARRIRPDRPLSAAERQARQRERYNIRSTALWFIAERAVSLDEARRAAAAALKGAVDYTEIYDGGFPPGPGPGKIGMRY